MQCVIYSNSLGARPQRPAHLLSEQPSGLWHLAALHCLLRTRCIDCCSFLMPPSPKLSYTRPLHGGQAAFALIAASLTCREA